MVHQQTRAQAEQVFRLLDHRRLMGDPMIWQLPALHHAAHAHSAPRETLECRYSGDHGNTLVRTRRLSK